MIVDNIKYLSSYLCIGQQYLYDKFEKNIESEYGF